MNSEKGLQIVPRNPEELEQGVVINVRRQRVIGANYFGKPTVEQVNEQNFTNLQNALDWATISPEYSHHFVIPMPRLELSAELNGPRMAKGEEMLAVKHNGKLGESMRNVDRHHGVSTNYENLFVLIINLEADQGPLFDRGVVWVDLSNRNASPKLTFHINAGVHTGDELRLGVAQMLLRVNQVLGDLVEGMGTSLQVSTK